MSAPVDQARSLAAQVWSTRLHAEEEAARHFRALTDALKTTGASAHLVAMAEQAHADELRHASVCRDLIEHFGGRGRDASPSAAQGHVPVALVDRQQLLREVVALSCITETLSTALLAELVRAARDEVSERAMRSILRDEVSHSRLGWAYLAEAHAAGAPDCVGPRLASMLDTSLGADFWRTEAPAPFESELAGFGQLPRADRQRLVLETLHGVVFPGLELFGIDVALGKAWCDAATR